VASVASAGPADLLLGARIRSLRLSRRMTLRELAGRTGLTQSFLSQVERDVTTPSIASVQRIAHALGLTIGRLFEEAAPTGRVVRREERQRIGYPGLGSSDEFLTRDGGRLQVILSTIDAGGGTGDDAYSHNSDEEVVVVLEGELELWVGDEHYLLGEGDAIAYPSRVPHRNRNPGATTARVIFCLTPPSF
jgi:transcriptional regulator with XRE-family HTH domain